MYRLDDVPNFVKRLFGTLQVVLSYIQLQHFTTKGFYPNIIWYLLHAWYHWRVILPWAWNGRGSLLDRSFDQVTTISSRSYFYCQNVFDSIWSRTGTVTETVDRPVAGKLKCVYHAGRSRGYYSIVIVTISLRTAFEFVSFTGRCWISLDKQR